METKLIRLCVMSAMSVEVLVVCMYIHVVLFSLYVCKLSFKYFRVVELRIFFSFR